MFSSQNKDRDGTGRRHGFFEATRSAVASDPALAGQPREESRHRFSLEKPVAVPRRNLTPQSVPECSILHVDADAFFPSVEQLLEPKYRGKPVIVGGGVRGVVASASYEARKFGIHSAMPLYQARKLCPHGIFVRGSHRVYAEFSRRIFTILQKYTPTVEITSIDEGYLDLSGTEQMHHAWLPTGRPDYLAIASRMLREVKEKVGLTLSGGLATSRVVAKIAASRFKPNKLTYVWPGYERDFLAPLSLQAMPGIGPKTLLKLQKFGLRTLGDLAALSPETVQQWMGGYGLELWERAQGIDRRPVALEPSERKSISEEKTFDTDIRENVMLIDEAMAMLRSLCFKIRQENFYAKTLTLKIRYADFQTFNHQSTLEAASSTATDFIPLLRGLFKKRDPTRRVRLIGVGLSQLQYDVQLSLFGAGHAGGVAKMRLDEKLDLLRKKYGSGVI